MLWSPTTQAVAAVFVVGGLLAISHLISIHVNAGGSVG